MRHDLKVLNPVAHVSTRTSVLAPRLRTLENKRIGLYWNHQAGGEVLLARVAQLLGSRYKGVEFTLIRSTLRGLKEKIEEAKTFDAIIASTAD